MGRAETAKQRKDGKRHDRQNSDFAECVEAAEVDKDDVDDIGAAAFRIGALQEIGRNRVRHGQGHHGIGDDGHADTACSRQQEVTGAAELRREFIAAVDLLEAFRQPSEAKQDENRGDDFHQ
ncbi:hypothetical protein D3C78_1282900 [compost metagenome]